MLFKSVSSYNLLKGHFQMNYSIEEIYCLVGKDDYVAGLTFKYESDAFNKYGQHITVVFVYSQFERIEMDKLIQVPFLNKNGWVKANYLGTDLEPDKVELLLKEGIYSGDIAEILFFNRHKKNTFHSKEKRELAKIEIPIRSLPKGGDFNWIYGFTKRLVSEGKGQSPKERAFYLAGKLYYEPEDLTKEELSEIDNSGTIDEQVEWEFLKIKFSREDISDVEKKQLIKLYSKKKNEDLVLLDKYLKQTGSSLKKLATENIDQAVKLSISVLYFRERTININAQYPIYIDLDGYLHIYMRHVEEFKVNSHFEHKDNFQWDEKDVLRVMGQIIKQIDNEYQEFRKTKPDQRFSKYGRQSIYFEGDYYTFHIELNGRISTFHKNRKDF